MDENKLPPKWVLDFSLFGQGVGGREVTMKVISKVISTCR